MFHVNQWSLWAAREDKWPAQVLNLQYFATSGCKFLFTITMIKQDILRVRCRSRVLVNLSITEYESEMLLPLSLSQYRLASKTTTAVPRANTQTSGIFYLEIKTLTRVENKVKCLVIVWSSPAREKRLQRCREDGLGGHRCYLIIYKRHERKSVH